MNKIWIASFTGRKIHAIGIFYQITVEVHAPTREVAEMKLYDDYEHIQSLTLMEKHFTDRE